MLLWNPNASQAYVLYILACISGLTTAIIKPFTTGLTFLKLKWFYVYIYFSALYGSIFVDTKETSFSVYTFIQNAGGLVVFLCSSAVRVRISIILQIVYLTLVTICYIVIEIRHRNTLKNIPTSIVLPNLVLIVTKQNVMEKF
jgi:hypothetical protein